jgi:N6-L-threonylcarbamoyladenine synthase
MIILGIETSCDETAVAIIGGNADGHVNILSERIASQIEIHAEYGGVVPEIASREHLQQLPPMVDEVMHEANLAWHDIESIAVTAGPGLMGALLVGVSFARAAGTVNNIPVIPIHHLEGHLFTPGLSGTLPDFPFITLLVSGGHTLLIRVDGLGQYVVLGQTLDDAAGECFDKCARLLDLPYPGGPAVAQLAQSGDANRFKLPRPMLNKGNLNFSFSGLKTAVLYAVRHEGEMNEQTRADMAAGVELAICEVLVKKSVRACVQENISHLVIAGGVAANSCLRAMLEQQANLKDIRIHLPELHHCTDNAAMIAHAGWLRLRSGQTLPENWDARPRWPLSEL